MKRSCFAVLVCCVRVGAVTPRRAWLGGLVGSGLGCSALVPPAFGRPTAALKPLVDIPLTRLRLPEGAFGGEYVVLPITLPGEVESFFMLDSALTLEIVSPALRSKLGLATVGSRVASTAGGTRTYEEVEIVGSSVGGVPLPPLHATVNDFPMEHIDSRREATGMLGLEFMALFDLDLDAPAGRLRLWRKGDGGQVARAARMREVPARILAGSVLAVRLAGRQPSAGAGLQPFVGIVDCGSSTTILTTEAAKLAGLDLLSSAAPPATLAGVGVGVDGAAVSLRVVDHLPLEFAGDYDPRTQRFATAARLPQSRIAIGDLPVFADLLGERSGKAAALIGMDILAQGRTIFVPSDSQDRWSLFWKAVE